MKTALFVTLMLLLSSAYAQPDMRPMNHPRMKMMEDLKLTDAQKDQFKKISFDTEKKQIELRSKLETARLELRRLMDADAPDKSAIEKKFNEISSIQAAMKTNHYNGWFEKNKALTPEQQKVWKRALLLHRNMAANNMHMMRDGMKSRMEHRRMMMRDDRP